MDAREDQQRRQWVVWWMLFLVALAVRTFRAWQEVIANPDVIRYVDQMHGLLRDPLGTMRTEVYHPLHAACGLLVHQVIGPLVADERMGWIWSLRIVGIVAGALLAVQIGRLARWFGAPLWAGVAAGLAWIVGRRTSVYGADGLSDMLTWALFCESLLAAMPALRELENTKRQTPNTKPWAARISWRLVWAGALAGLAYLARPEGAAAVVILGGSLGILATCRQRGIFGAKMWRRRFKVLPRHRIGAGRAAVALACLAAGFLLLAAPYMVAIRGFTGKKPLLAGVMGSAVGNAPIAPTVSVSVDTLPTGGGVTAVRKVTIELAETFFWPNWLVVLLAVPLWPRLWGRARLRVVALVWIGLWDAVMYWLLHVAGYLDGRHTLPLVLFLHVMLALALVAWTRPMSAWMARYRRDAARWAKLAPWRRWRGWPRLCAGAVMALALVPGVIDLSLRPRRDKENLLAAAAFIRLHARPEVVVCDAERLVGYYSNRPYAPWRGSQRAGGVDNPNWEEVAAARQAHGGVPAILGKVYLPGDGVIPAELGGYQEIARFQSGTSTNRDVYVLYAQGTDWQRQP